MKNRQAFTVVETLVVIAVLAVLLVILLPVLNHVRQRSLTAKCMGNIRSYGLAVLSMVTDNGTLRYWDGLGSSLTTTGKPQYMKDLVRAGYFEENKPLRCPLADTSKMNDVPGQKRFPYAGNIWLCHYYPRLKGIPAPLHRVALAGEVNHWDGWDSWTAFNDTVWNGGSVGEEGNQYPVARYHGSPQRRGLHFFFVDGSVRLLTPVGGDWRNPPTAAPTSGVAREGAFYHGTHIKNLANGDLTAP